MKKIISIIIIILLISVANNVFATETSSGDCKHENGSVFAKDNKDGTHTTICELCGDKIKTENHT